MAEEERDWYFLVRLLGRPFSFHKGGEYEDKSKGNPRALLPIGVFLVIFLGAGILSGDFYTCLPL